MSKELLIIGGDGHGSVIAAAVSDNITRYGDNEWHVAGFVNDFDTKVDGYPVLGGTADINSLASNGYYFAWGIHLIGKNPLTKEAFDRIRIPADHLATIVHRSAFIGEDVILDPGCFVGPNTYIAPRTHLGMCSMVKANVCIGHDVVCGSLCHFAMGSIIGSFTQVGTCSDVALGSVVLEKRKIGDYSMLGAHSLLTKDIPDYEVHVGSPARFFKKIQTQ